MRQSDEYYMQIALERAKVGQGFVEPNPMVGCILVRDGEIIGSGAHEYFGGPHAEVNAIASVDSSVVATPGESGVSGATAFVTLEPCSHKGQTGPCAEALIRANVSRVVIAVEDPNPLVSGRGIDKLRAAGIDVATGVMADAASRVLAPYLKRTTQNKPWMIAKWAMTIDGKIATSTGDSQWISNESSRSIVHSIRGRVDGVLVGVGTAIADNPLLNARPPGARHATRIVVDSNARIPLSSKLLTTTDQVKTMIAVGPSADPQKCEQIKRLGASIFQGKSHDPNVRLGELLTYLASLGMTNVLVEGGGQLLGSLHDLNQIDEVHVFIGPKLLGGFSSLEPVGGDGRKLMSDSTAITIESVEKVEGDVYIVGRTQR